MKPCLKVAQAATWVLLRIPPVCNPSLRITLEFPLRACLFAFTLSTYSLSSLYFLKSAQMMTYSQAKEAPLDDNGCSIVSCPYCRAPLRNRLDFAGNGRCRRCIGLCQHDLEVMLCPDCTPCNQASLPIHPSTGFSVCGSASATPGALLRTEHAGSVSGNTSPSVITRLTWESPSASATGQAQRLHPVTSVMGNDGARTNLASPARKALGACGVKPERQDFLQEAFDDHSGKIVSSKLASTPNRRKKGKGSTNQPLSMAAAGKQEMLSDISQTQVDESRQTTMSAFSVKGHVCSSEMDSMATPETPAVPFEPRTPLPKARLADPVKSLRAVSSQDGHPMPLLTPLTPVSAEDRCSNRKNTSKRVRNDTSSRTRIINPERARRWKNPLGGGFPDPEVVHGPYMEVGLWPIPPDLINPQWPHPRVTLAPGVSDEEDSSGEAPSVLTQPRTTNEAEPKPPARRYLAHKYAERIDQSPDTTAFSTPLMKSLGLARREVKWGNGAITLEDCSWVCFPMMGRLGRAMGFVYANPAYISREWPTGFPGKHSLNPPNAFGGHDPIRAGLVAKPDMTWAFVRQLVCVYDGDGYYRIATETVDGVRTTPNITQACARQAAGTLFSPDHPLHSSNEDANLDDPDRFVEELARGRRIQHVPRYTQECDLESRIPCEQAETASTVLGQSAILGPVIQNDDTTLINVMVRCPNGIPYHYRNMYYTFTLHVRAKHVLGKIAASSDVKAADMLLIFNGLVLSPDQLLGACGVVDQSVLLVSIIMKAEGEISLGSSFQDAIAPAVISLPLQPVTLMSQNGSSDTVMAGFSDDPEVCSAPTGFCYDGKFFSQTSLMSNSTSIPPVKGDIEWVASPFKVVTLATSPDPTSVINHDDISAWEKRMRPIFSPASRCNDGESSFGLPAILPQSKFNAFTAFCDSSLSPGTKLADLTEKETRHEAVYQQRDPKACSNPRWETFFLSDDGETHQYHEPTIRIFVVLPPPLQIPSLTSLYVPKSVTPRYLVHVIAAISGIPACEFYLTFGGKMLLTDSRFPDDELPHASQVTLLLRLRGGGISDSSESIGDFLNREGTLTPEEKTLRLMAMSREAVDAHLRELGEAVDNNDSTGRAKMTLCRLMVLPLPDVSAITIDAGRYIVDEWWNAQDAPAFSAKRAELCLGRWGLTFHN